MKFRIVAAGTCFKQASRPGPGACVHPTAVEKLLNEVKEGMGTIDTCAPDNIMPARNGAFPEVWREMAELTDSDPAD